MPPNSTFYCFHAKESLKTRYCKYYAFNALCPPVAIRKRVRKAIPKDLKWACSPSPWHGCCSSHSAVKPIIQLNKTSSCFCTKSAEQLHTQGGEDEEKQEKQQSEIPHLHLEWIICCHVATWPGTWGSACITVSSSDLIPFAIFSSFRTRAILGRRVRLQWYFCLKEHKARDCLSSSYAMSLSNELYYLNVFTLIPSWPELLWGLLETPPPEMMSRYCHFCVDIIFFIVWISTSISSRMMPRTDRATMAMSSWFHLINSKFYICLRHIYLDSKEMNKKNERCFIPKGEWNEINLKGHQFDSHHK